MNAKPYLNLLEIKLPIAGVVSILHRVSGVLLVLALPIILLSLHYALASEESFAQVANLWQSIVGKIIAFGIIWATSHHVCSGIRFLLLDLHIGVEISKARTSAKLVVVATIVLATVTWLVIYR